MLYNGTAVSFVGVIPTQGGEFCFFSARPGIL